MVQLALSVVLGLLATDTVCGDWVCLADNEHPLGKVPLMTMHLDDGGVATFHSRREGTVKVTYRCMPIQAWGREDGVSVNNFGGPSAKVVEFVDPASSRFAEGGSSLLIYRDGMLINPITMIWCRRGQETESLRHLRH